MKKHAIIPIFIPHAGCENDCVFCNQRIITAHDLPMKGQEVEKIIQRNLKTLKPQNLSTIEVAFFGGSFTGISKEEQEYYLSIAKKYKDAGEISKIHLSTRPDYIDKEILHCLTSYSVDTIELGAQSFDNEVLNASKRGHNRQQIITASHLIKEAGMQLGIQLMIGLPRDTKEKAMASAMETVSLSPSLARIYPTLVLKDTELEKMYNEGSYSPLSQQDAISISKEVYKILLKAKIYIMRVGLKSTDFITTNSVLGGGYHPAFRQLVEGEIAKDQMVPLLKKDVTFYANSMWFNNMIGHKACNKKYFQSQYPHCKITYKVNPSLPNGKIAVEPST